MTLQDKIDEALLRLAKEREGRERSGKFGSSKFGNCYRRQVMDRANIPPSDPLELKTLHIFEAGKVVHDYIQQYIEPEAVEVKVEAEDFIGYADIVTEDSVLDIKSVNPAYFFFGWKNKAKVEFSVAEINEMIPTKKVNNILQVTDYAMRLGKPRIGLVFFSRDLSYGIRAHEWMDFTAKWEGLVLLEREELVKHWEIYKEKGELPDKCPRLYDGREGKYCPYQTLCGGCGA